MKITTADDVFRVIGTPELIPLNLCVLGAKHVVMPGESTQVNFNHLTSAGKKLLSVTVDGKKVSHGETSFTYTATRKTSAGFKDVAFELEYRSEADAPKVVQTHKDLLRVADPNDPKVLQFFTRALTTEESANMTALAEAGDIQKKLATGEIYLPEPINADDYVPDESVLIDDDDDDAADIRGSAESAREALQHINGIIADQAAKVRRFDKFLKIDERFRDTIYAIITMARNQDGNRIFTEDDIDRVMNTFDYQVIGNFGSLLWQVANPTTVETALKN